MVCVHQYGFNSHWDDPDVKPIFFTRVQANKGDFGNAHRRFMIGGHPKGGGKFDEEEHLTDKEV